MDISTLQGGSRSSLKAIKSNDNLVGPDQEQEGVEFGQSELVFKTQPLNNSNYILDHHQQDYPMEVDLNTLTISSNILQYLISKDYLLSALEFFTELSEDGVHIRQYKEYFANHRNFEVGSMGRYRGHPRNASDMSARSVGHGRFASDLTGNDVDTLSSLEDSKSKQSESVSMSELPPFNNDYVASLESDLASLRTENDNLRKKLEALQQSMQSVQASSGKDVNLIKQDIAGLNSQTQYAASAPSASQTPQRQPILSSRLQRRLLNYMVNQFLVKNGWKMTSATFLEEIEDFGPGHYDDSLYKAFEQIPSLNEVFNAWLNSLAKSSTPIALSVYGGNEEHFSSSFAGTIPDSSTPVNLARSRVRSDSKSSVVSISETIRRDLADVQIYGQISQPAQFNRRQDNRAPSTDAQSLIARDNKLALSLPVQIVSSKEDQVIKSTYSQLLHRFYELHTQSAATNQATTVFGSRSLVHALTDNLGEIVANTLLTKREQLMELLFLVLSVCPNEQDQDKLIKTLLTLIRKPDERQRTVVCQGFVKLTHILGSSGHAMADKVVQNCVIELAGTKFIERKVLATEICGALAPYLERKDSLIDSARFLCACMDEQDSSLLQFHAVKSLAAVLDGAMRDEVSSHDCNPIVSLLYPFLEKALDSVSLDVVSITNEVFCGVLFEFLSHCQLLKQHGGQQLFDCVQQISQSIEAYFGENIDAVLDPASQYKISRYAKLLQKAIPDMHKTMLASSPWAEDGVSLKDRDADDGIGQDIDFKALSVKFNTSLVNAEGIVWPAMVFCTQSFVTLLIQLLSKCNPNNVVAASEFSRVLLRFCSEFGHVVTDYYVKTYFVDIVDVKLVTFRTENRIIPLFCGYIPALRQPVKIYAEQLERLLCLWSSSQALQTSKLCILRQAVSNLLQSDKSFVEPSLDVCSKLADTDNTDVKLQISPLLSTIVPHLSQELLLSKLVPVLLQLINDADRKVRISAISTITTLLEIAGRNTELLERLEIQIANFLFDSVPLIQLETLKAIALTVLYVDESFRDNFILPAMARWCANELKQRKTSTAEDRDWTLKLIQSVLQIYQGLTNVQAREQQIQTYILPSLSAIMQHLQVVMGEEKPNAMQQQSQVQDESSRGADINLLIWVQKLISEFSRMVTPSQESPVDNLNLSIAGKDKAKAVLKPSQSLLANLLRLDTVETPTSKAVTGVNFQTLLSASTPKSVSPSTAKQTTGNAESDSVSRKLGAAFFTSKLFSKFSDKLTVAAAAPPSIPVAPPQQQQQQQQVDQKSNENNQSKQLPELPLDSGSTPQQAHQTSGSVQTTQVKVEDKLTQIAENVRVLDSQEVKDQPHVAFKDPLLMPQVQQQLNSDNSDAVIKPKEPSNKDSLIPVINRNRSKTKNLFDIDEADLMNMSTSAHISSPLLQAAAELSRMRADSELSKEHVVEAPPRVPSVVSEVQGDNESKALSLQSLNK
ncbi:hypothetical protein MP228_008744 [Amoeboaphelidium protococcarum]|nr:hypothetical protein MP228_008744 [Amoeboaphelidium protococcarum]